MMLIMLVCLFSNKGVQVELGIPYELWDRPSAEVSKMHRAVSFERLCISCYRAKQVLSLYCIVLCTSVDYCYLILLRNKIL